MEEPGRAALPRLPSGWAIAAGFQRFLFRVGAGRAELSHPGYARVIS